MSLEDLRKKIDEADETIVKLIADRVRIAREIGKEKQKDGQQIEDLSREQKVLDHVARIAGEENLNQAGIEAIYRQIMLVTKSLEGTTVAFQGENGAYSEAAATGFFGPAIHTMPCESLDDVFQTVTRGGAQYGIVPIENSLEGSISRTYDLLLDSDLRVCGETELRVIHCLIANPETTLEMVKRVYSHPQALGQCRNYLNHRNFETVPTYDTAGSVKMIKEQHITDGAAIAGTRAAEIYGMQILAREIEDNPNNFTRFFILSSQDAAPSGDDKTSIVFSVKHKPGALYEFLRELADNKINLTKIESRPSRQKPWEYNFYLDFEGHHQDKIARKALDNLEQNALFVKVLGSYPRAK